jgi:hypothetical protein
MRHWPEDPPMLLPDPRLDMVVDFTGEVAKHYRLGATDMCSSSLLPLRFEGECMDSPPTAADRGDAGGDRVVVMGPCDMAVLG